MNRVTHNPTVRVEEYHKGKVTRVPERTVGETIRLQYLRKELDPTQEWTVTRRLMNGWEVRVSVDAVQVREAKAVADEVTYALNWLNGAFKDDKFKKGPEEWALKYTDYELVRS